jgi:benzoate-CoA ligase
VVGQADEDELIKPLALVVLSSGRSGDDALAAELKAHVKERLAPYKYPRWFEWRASLPKNDRGKVARMELKREVLERIHGGTP